MHSTLLLNIHTLSCQNEVSNPSCRTLRQCYCRSGPQTSRRPSQMWCMSFHPTGNPCCSNSDIDQSDCITDLLGQAKDLGCDTSDVICLCQNEDFGHGIHDCTYESCPASADKQKVIDAGTEYCRRKFDRYGWLCRREYSRLRRSLGCRIFRDLFSRIGRHWQ